MFHLTQRARSKGQGVRSQRSEIRGQRSEDSRQIQSDAETQGRGDAARDNKSNAPNALNDLTNRRINEFPDRQMTADYWM